MNQIILVCGNWRFERKKWIFMNNKRGTRSILASDRTPFTSFKRMVFEDFRVDSQKWDVELSYMLPKKVLKKETPPVIVDGSRPFLSFLDHCKTEALQLYVELKNLDDKEDDDDLQKVDPKSRKRKFSEDDNENENMFSDLEEEDLKRDEKGTAKEGDDEDLVHQEDDSDDDYRFDYCDDTDGVTSDDEDFTVYGRSHVEEEEEETNMEEEETNLAGQKNCLPPTNEEVQLVKDCCTQVEQQSLKVAVGQSYATREALMTKLKFLTVLEKFDFNVDRSTPELLIVVCWVEGCSWRLRASPIDDSSRFVVRIYEGNHTCSVTERSARSRKATPDILGSLYKYVICGGGTIDKAVLPKHVAQTLTSRFGVQMDYGKARKTLIAARELDRGTPENGYAMLPSYLYGIRRENPGTLTRLEVDVEDRFMRLFIAFGASIMGFPYMRKVVIVDGTFLQGKYKGTLLVASAQDGNFQIYPIAFAIVDTENDQSWEWFFIQLNRVIPDDNGLSIISDRHKSIGKAISKIYPLANRGIYTYHLHKNIILRFRGATVFGLVKKAAAAFKMSEFDALFNQIEALNPQLHGYLEKADKKLWSRAYFQGDRYNLLTTNIAESMNRVLKDFRGLPIVHLLEEIRFMMTRWFSQKRKAARELHTLLSRGLEKLLEERVDYAKHLKVQEIDDHQAEVTGKSSSHIVNLKEKRCSCRRFDLERFPCVHAIAVAEKRKVPRISLCHPYYSKNYLCNAYKYSIMPRDIDIPVPEKVSATLCLPPNVKQPPGRPKKSRVKSAIEVAMEKKRPRKPHTCSNCKQPGHNRATCRG